MTGYSAAEAVRHHCFDNFLMHVDQAGCQLCLGGCPLGKTIADGKNREADLFLRHHEGHRVPVRIRVAPIHTEDGGIVGAVEIFSDMTAVKKLERMAGDLEDLAYYDALTRVANRRYIELKVHQALQEIERFGRAYGIVLVDIDRFKAVNDRYGHQMGDSTLKTLCQTLAHCIRPGDTIGRWGGDEFLVIARDVTAASLEQLAERCCRMIDATLVPIATGAPLRIQASVGATLLRPGDHCSVALHRADQLMYASKDAGRNCVHLG